MALKNFKALKDFERDGVSVKSGEELVLTEREGEKRVKAGEVMDGRFLDPADPKDAEKIEAAEAEYDEKYEANMAKEAARDEAKQEELAEDDEKREALVEEGKQLLTEIANADGEEPNREELEGLSRLETPVLEKRIAELREKKPAEEVDDSMKRDELEAVALKEGMTQEEIDGAETKADLVQKIQEKRKSK